MSELKMPWDMFPHPTERERLSAWMQSLDPTEPREVDEEAVAQARMFFGSIVAFGHQQAQQQLAEKDAEVERLQSTVRELVEVLREAYDRIGCGCCFSCKECNDLSAKALAAIAKHGGEQ